MFCLMLKFCSPNLHLFDPKYSKNSNILKYLYYLKQLFPFKGLRCVDFDALGEQFAWYVWKHMWNQSRCNGTSERVTSQTRKL